MFNFKFITKKDLISDAGVHQKGNHVDVFTIFGCIAVGFILIFLGFMAYYVDYLQHF